jgi:hypothetical protein
MNKTVNNSRVDRITLLIQEYTYVEKVVHIKDRHNCLFNYLSREQIDGLFDVKYGLHSQTISVPHTSTINNVVAGIVLRPRTNGK